MKMTMNIDEALLKRAMRIAGTTSKTETVDLALRELERRGSLAKILRQGMGMSPAELGEMFDPAYDLDAMRRAEMPTPASHATRPRPRR